MVMQIKRVVAVGSMTECRCASSAEFPKQPSPVCKIEFRTLFFLAKNGAAHPHPLFLGEPPGKVATPYC